MTTLIFHFIKNLFRTNSIQDKRKHFFQLPQMFKMSSTSLQALSQHFSKTRNCPVSIGKRMGFLSLWDPLIAQCNREIAYSHKSV